jgi:hypothetical protein
MQTPKDSRPRISRKTGKSSQRRDNKAIKINIAPTKIKNLLMPEIGIKIPPFPC